MGVDECDKASVTQECLALFNFVNTALGRHQSALDALSSHVDLASGAAQLYMSIVMLSISTPNEQYVRPGALCAATSLLLAQLLERLPLMPDISSSRARTLDAIRSVITLDVLPHIIRAAVLQLGPFSKVVLSDHDPT